MAKQVVTQVVRTELAPGETLADMQTRSGKTPQLAETTVHASGASLKVELYNSTIAMEGIAFPRPTADAFTANVTASEALQGIPFTLRAYLAGTDTVRPKIMLDGAVLVGQQYVLTTPGGVYYFNGENSGLFVPDADWVNSLLVGQTGRETTTYTATILGASAVGVITIDITGEAVVADQNPVVGSALPALNGVEDEAFSYTAPAGVFVDPDGDAFTYEWTNAGGEPLEDWLTSNGLNINGTPPQDFNGAINLRLTGTANGKTVFQETTLTIAPVDDLVTGTPPVLTTNNAPKVVRYSDHLTDADGDPIQPVSVTVQGGAAEYTTSIGAGPNYDVTFTPNVAFSGQTYADVTFSDGAVIRQQLVNLEANAPVIVDPTFNQNEDALAPMDVSSSVTYGAGQSFAALTLIPASGLISERTTGPVLIDGITYNVVGQTIVPTAPPHLNGSFQVGYVYEQSDGKLGSGTLYMPVASINDPITWSHGDATTPIALAQIEDVDTPHNLRPYYSDVDSLQAQRNILSVNGTNLVTGSFVTVSGWGFKLETSKNVTIRPPLNYNRDLSVAPVFEIVASDPEGATVTGYFQPDVSPRPDPPTIAGNPPSVDLTAGQGSGAIELTGTSVDNAILSWTAVSSNSNAVVATIPGGGINAGTSVVSLQINAVSGAATGTHSVTVTLSDNAGQQTQIVIVVNVTAASGAQIGPDPRETMAPMHDEVNLYLFMKYNLATNFTVKSGAWNDPTVWAFGVPVTGARVVIKAGHNVILPPTMARMDWIIVDGTLRASTIANSDVWAETVWAAHGLVELGTQSNPIPWQYKVLWRHADVGPLDIVRDPAGIIRGLIVGMRGNFRSQGGFNPFKTHTTATASLPTGASSINVADASGFPAVPFRICVASTTQITQEGVLNDLDGSTRKIRVLQKDHEYVNVTAVSGNTLTLETTLQKAHNSKTVTHFGVIETHYASIGIAESNITITSENTAAQFQRGHNMFMNWEYIRGVDFSGCGRTSEWGHVDGTSFRNSDIHNPHSADYFANLNIRDATNNLIGRYHLHLHKPSMNLDPLPEMGDVSGNICIGGFGWQIVQHGGFTQLTWNCCYEASGAAMIGEEGTEIDIWSHNLVVATLTGRNKNIKNGGDCGEAYAFKGRHVQFRNNVSAGCAIGEKWTTRPFNGRGGSPYHTDFGAFVPLTFNKNPTDILSHLVPILSRGSIHWGCGESTAASIGGDSGAFLVGRANSEAMAQWFSLVQDFRWLNCGYGLLSEYAGKYLFVDGVADGNNAGIDGFRLTKGIAAFHIAHCTIDGYQCGILSTDDWAGLPPTDTDYIKNVYAENEFRNCTQEYQHTLFDYNTGKHNTTRIDGKHPRDVIIATRPAMGVTATFNLLTTLPEGENQYSGADLGVYTDSLDTNKPMLFDGFDKPIKLKTPELIEIINSTDTVDGFRKVFVGTEPYYVITRRQSLMDTLYGEDSRTEFDVNIVINEEIVASQGLSDAHPNYRGEYNSAVFGGVMA